MDILLPQIQEFCRQEFSWVRNSDVALIPNPGIIPGGVGFPYIGLKDGVMDIHYDTMALGMEADLVVDIYIYDTLDRLNRNILGLHQKGRQLMNSLKGKCFDGGIISAVPRILIPIALLYTKKGLVIRKGLRIEYEREE